MFRWEPNRPCPARFPTDPQSFATTSCLAGKTQFQDVRIMGEELWDVLLGYVALLDTKDALES